jgi:hypothetical protein
MVRPIYRTGTPLPPKPPILYIFSTNIRTEFFKHAAHTSFFYLQTATFFGSCIIVILHTGCATNIRTEFFNLLAPEFGI